MVVRGLRRSKVAIHSTRSAFECDRTKTSHFLVKLFLAARVANPSLMINRLLVIVLFDFAALVFPSQAAIVINEIRDHLSAENPDEKYRGFSYSGAAPVVVGGWQFTNGVKFTFPATAFPGTPGVANSVAAADFAPIITNPAHFPLIPAHTEKTVTVPANRSSI